MENRGIAIFIIDAFFSAHDVSDDLAFLIFALLVVKFWYKVYTQKERKGKEKKKECYSNVLPHSRPSRQ